MPLTGLTLPTDYFSNAIKNKGGGALALLELDPNATIPYSPLAGAGWSYLGFLKNTSVTDDTENDLDEKDERGLLVQSIDGDQIFSIETVLMQRDAASVGIGRSTRGKRFACYYYAGITNGKHQEFVVAVCKVSAKVKSDYESSKVTTIPITIKALSVIGSSVVYPPLPCVEETNAPSGWVSNVVSASPIRPHAFAIQRGYAGAPSGADYADGGTGTGEAIPTGGLGVTAASTPAFYGAATDAFNSTTKKWSPGQLSQLFETPAFNNGAVGV